VRATSWQLAAKTLRPLPNEHHPLSEEARVRQRYLDMVVRPEAREIVRVKAAVLKSFRSTLDARGFIEVETPVLQLVHGGAARPFRTHLHAFDQDMVLRIALELDLKKAVAGGIDRVYEIGKTFRNEGIDSTHSAEFLMLEAYEAYGDYDTMADLTRELVLGAARALGRTIVPGRDGSQIDLEAPWRKAGIFDLVSAALGEQVDIDTDLAQLRRHAAARDVALQPEWGAAHGGGGAVRAAGRGDAAPAHVRQRLPVGRQAAGQGAPLVPGLNEAWDLIINGVELAPAYSELNDPVVQRERLVEQARLAAAGDPEAMDLDEDFLRAMEHGMPPMGGVGLGVDRLVMLLMGTGIREAILFPWYALSEPG
jgi:lysyl-tRNA synthetase class 2